MCGPRKPYIRYWPGSLNRKGHFGGHVPAFPGTMDVSILRSRQTEPTAHAAVDNFAE